MADKPTGRRTTAGTRQLNLEIGETLIDNVRAFARERGETLRQVVEMALSRHLANPPPPPVIPPLPPLPTAAATDPPAAKPKGRKK